MAVEIPVVIDIEGAFDEAAKKVDMAIRPLKRKIDDETASLKLTVGVDEFGGALKKTVKQITDITKLLNGKVKLGASMQEVSTALESAKNSYAVLETLRSKGARVDMGRLNSLREAIIILTQEVEQRQRMVGLVTEEAQRQIQVKRAIEDGDYALIQEAKTMSQLSDKISSLRGKLANIDPKSKEWGQTAREIRTATNELGKLDEKLKNTLGASKAGSINRMTEDMRKLEEQWNAMSRTQKFDKDGNLKASAQKIIEKYKQLADQAEKTGKSLRELTAKPKEKLAEFNETASKTSSLMRQLKSYATSFVSVWSAVSLVKRIRETTAEFELQEVALGGILQNARMAHSLFEQIKSAAVESPFFVKDLVTYTKQLSAYRIETDKLFDVTMQLADVSAGLGVDMNRLILAYGQVRAASVLRGQELRQFTEAGVPLVELLADKFTELRGTMVSTADVFKLISERAVPFSMIEEIFNDMTSAGGMFYKMQEKQAETLAGRWNNLKDSIAIALDEAGRTEEMQELFDAMIALAKSFVKYLPTMVKVAKDLAVAFVVWRVRAIALNAANSKLLTTIVKTRVETLKTIATSKKGVNAMNNTSRAANLLYARMNLLQKGILNVRMAFKALLSTLKANPFGAAIAGVSSILALFDLIGSRDEESVGIGDIGAFIANAEKQYKDVNYLADTYDKLTAKQELNEREQKQLAAVTNELAKAYHGKAMEIDEATGKIKINTKEVRKLSKEEKEARKIQLQAEKERIEGYNKTNEARLKYLSIRMKFEREQEILGKSTADIERERTAAYLASGLTEEEIKKIQNWLNGGDTLNAMNKVTEWLDTGREQIAEIEHAFEALEPTADNLNGWQSAIIGVQDEYTKTGAIFSHLSDEQLQNFSTLHDALTQFAKDWKESGKSIKTSEESLESLNKQFEGLNAMDKVRKSGWDIFRAIADVKKELELSQANKEFFEKIFALFGVDPNELLKKLNGGQTAYTQPAYIANMNEQLKFMKDFEKGYRDLEKYMGKANALSEEFANMSARGLALGLGEEEQKRAAEGLSDWYKDVLDKTADEMRKKTGLRGSVQELLSYQITGSSNRDKMIRDFQKLLQQIFDARTDFNTDKLKKNIEEALKDVNEKIKRSETARNFFNDILEATGDEKIALDAAVSVYGTPGKDFQDRIQEEMGAELKRLRKIKTDSGKSIIDDSLYQDLMAAINTYDMDRIRELFELLPTAAQDAFKKVLDEEETFNRNWIKNFYDTYSKTKTFQERVDTLESRRTRKLMEAQKMGRSESDIEAINAYFDKQVAGVRLEELKEKYAWTKTFEDLEGVSNETLNSIIALIDEYVEKYWSDLEPTQQKELIRARENAEAQKLERNAFKGVISAIEEIISATREKNALEDAGKEKTEDHAKAADRQAKALFKLKNALDQISSAYDNLASNAKDLMNVFASDEDASYYGQQLDNLSKTLSGVAATSVGIGKILTGTATPQDYLNTISGIADTITGIFGARNARRIRQADKDIKEQQRLIDNLKESYDRLGDAMAKSFGSDYIYNFQTQLKLLEAQVAAYRKQADAERGKGKKADADAVREYEKSAREVEQQIKDMRDGLSSFFTGTDVTSAAKDFASAWLDAYRSFSSTTGAMKEKFQDLVQEMVTNSLAAQMVQSILGPWFEQIDNMAKSGGILDAKEISQIAAETGGYVDVINAALTNLMNELAGAGLNMREKVGSLTGIKREIGGATEETMSAVAVGLNTQNFYMSFVPTIGADVAAIREALTGESSVTRSSVNVSSSGFGDDVFRGQMSRIDENIMEIRTLLKSVISPRGTTASTHSVSVKY